MMSSESRKSSSYRKDHERRKSSQYSKDDERRESSKSSRKKSSLKDKVEKEATDKVYRAGRAIKRTGIWDGSVVEEVFMEMTGVSVGHADYMASDWKN
jgi:hypothetical protein